MSDIAAAPSPRVCFLPLQVHSLEAWPPPTPRQLEGRKTAPSITDVTNISLLTGSHAAAGLAVLQQIFLPPPPERWDYRPSATTLGSGTSPCC